MGKPLSDKYKLYGKIRAEEKIQDRYFPDEDNRFSFSEHPTYRLISVDFNPNTLSAKLLFERSQLYKTVDRYVQRNYERTPIYSDWKVKTNKIQKNIKLTNAVLENLNYNDDLLIKAFSMHIILTLDNEDLTPSWFIKECLDCENAQRIKALKFKIQYTTDQTDSAIKNCTSSIKNEEIAIEIYTKFITKTGKKLDKLDKKITKIENHKKNVFLDIITLSIYALLNSAKRVAHLRKKREKQQNRLNKIQIHLNKSFQVRSENEKKIETLQLSCINKIKKFNDEIAATTADYLRKKDKIEPLNTTVDSYECDNSFIPLKKIIALEYEKIIGVYVIKNNEKNKYYVGQSKDVLKRIKQHFKGTTPANIIFAEDYFASKWDKEDLFSVKIIKLNTKDELDYTEKQLIQEYDARINGYNGTIGNS